MASSSSEKGTMSGPGLLRAPPGPLEGPGLVQDLGPSSTWLGYGFDSHNLANPGERSEEVWFRI